MKLCTTCKKKLPSGRVCNRCTDCNTQYMRDYRACSEGRQAVREAGQRYSSKPSSKIKRNARERLRRREGKLPAPKRLRDRVKVAATRMGVI